MKASRFKYEYRESASKLHRTVGELLRTSEVFGNFQAYQEYPVNRVNPDYPESSHHFDWVIPKLMLVIECHGKQHYVPTAFDGNQEAALENFYALKGRDKFKKEAAIAAGFTYVEVPYTLMKTVNEDWLLQAIREGEKEVLEYAQKVEEDLRLKEERERRAELEALKVARKEANKERKRKFIESSKHKRTLEKAKEYRQQRYKKAKEFKKNGRRP